MARDPESEDIAQMLDQLNERTFIDDTRLPVPALYSISLNVSQTCNMGCVYCYADEGKFGGAARMMKEETARATVDHLLASSEAGATVVVGFMGGEPLLSRSLIHNTVKYATEAAQKAGKRVKFSITTNGTLITDEDARLFTTFPFTVAFSIDGPQHTNDALRPMKNGSGSYNKVIEGLNKILKYGRPEHLSARVTVSPKTGRLLPILDHLVSLGFDEVGFSAVVVSPRKAHEFDEQSFQDFTHYMIECGEKAKQALLSGIRYPFGNFEVALNEIHRGSHKPYPCGAGAAYLSANAEGKLYACHRLIDNQDYVMGSVYAGHDDEARAALLNDKHVHLQEPCNSCWARYLCGGGCYHEVSLRGRNGCNYIKDWLTYCLAAYAELSERIPEYFKQPKDFFETELYSTSTI